MENLATTMETVITITKSCMGLFTEFPLNIMLVGGLAGIGFGIFASAKRAAR